MPICPQTCKHILLAIFLLPLFSWAQEPGYVQYGPKDGLPSSNIYEIEFDHAGRMWMGTENGLVAFDGDRFRTFDESHGLPGSDVLDIICQEDYGIFLKIFGQQPGIFRAGAFYKLPLPDSSSIGLNNLWPYKDGNETVRFQSTRDGLISHFPAHPSPAAKPVPAPCP